MKLLLDENLSDRIVAQVLDLYPGSAHVKTHGLISSDDTAIWSFARQAGFSIVSKDVDFHQRSLVYGAPPKFLFIRAGNCPTSEIVHILRSSFQSIFAFHVDPDAAILILS